MEPFTRLTAIAVPLPQPDIDTDMLIPQRYLRQPLTVGYRNFFFYNDRFDAEGKERPDFILNREPYKRGRILVTGRNFGCGSTREGAVYAATDFGVRAIVAPSFGPFYATNCYQNGVLPVVLPEADVREIIAALQASPGAEVTIDLETQTVTAPGGKTYRFEIEPSRKERLLQGLDDIGITQRYESAIAEYERKLDAELPWMSGAPLKSLVQS
jgi:3-isopropylmalate/(R)-2-methylmalate dehydratase small subunit